VLVDIPLPLENVKASYRFDTGLFLSVKLEYEAFSMESA